MINKIYILTIAVFLSFGAGAEEYRVALPFIPHKLRPRDNQINIAQYISYHLYYPLVQIDDEGQYASDFLDLSKSTALNTEFKDYKMCLMKNLYYSDGTAITITDLNNSLVQFHAENDQATNFDYIKVISQDCLIIRLKNSSPRYFTSLAGISSTILKTGTENMAVPVGMGKYKCVTYERRLVVLELFKNDLSIKFKKVKYSVPDKFDFDSTFFHDPNFVLQLFNLADKTKYQIIIGQQLKTYALVVNNDDANFRKCLGMHFNSKLFANEYKLNLKTVSGFLPEGIMGSSVTYLRPVSCRLNEIKGSTRLIIPFRELYYNVTKNKKKIFGAMANYINIKHVNITDFPKLVFSKSPYIAAMGFDSSGTNLAYAAEPIVFFESFYKDNRLITKSLAKLKEILSEVSLNKPLEIKKKSFEEAHKYLLYSGHVVPLGQLNNFQYFDKNLKNFVFYKPISGFPRIDLLR